MSRRSECLAAPVNDVDPMVSDEALLKKWLKCAYDQNSVLPEPRAKLKSRQTQIAANKSKQPKVATLISAVSDQRSR